MTRAALLVLLAVGCGEAEAAPIPAPPTAPVTATVSAPAPAEAPAPAVVLEASGDLVLNGLAMRSVRTHETEQEGYRALLAGYGGVLEEGAITFVNLEMPLVDHHVELDGGWPRSRTERPRRAPVLGATPVLAEVLAELGVDVVSVANNHALDQGFRGLSDTLAALDAAHLAAFGAGATRDAAYAPLVIERGGVRVAFVGGTEGINQRATDGPRLEVARTIDEAALLAAIRAARGQADVVVAAVHWSTDFVTEVSGAQRSLAAAMVEAGADVILGTGPHVLQPVERLESARGDAIVAYSLGNLASGMGRAYRFGERPTSFIHPANVIPEARDGVVLRIEARPGERLALEARAILLFTENDFLAHGERLPSIVAVRPLAALDPAVCRDRLPAMRAGLGPTLTLVPAGCD